MRRGSVIGAHTGPDRAVPTPGRVQDRSSGRPFTRNVIVPCWIVLMGLIWFSAAPQGIVASVALFVGGAFVMPMLLLMPTVGAAGRLGSFLRRQAGRVRRSGPARRRRTRTGNR
jgi:hypothetical protein